MRNFINILEGADEFSTKGHADMKIKINDPRFGDNPLAYDDDDSDEAERADDIEDLNELDTSTFGSRSSIDKLHDMFAHAGVSDQEIAHGFHLTDVGLHKVAARLGVGPHEVDMMMRSLSQKLKDDTDQIEEQYRSFIESEAVEEDGRPFEDEADDDDGLYDGDHLSAEEDVLGNVTVRSAKRGTERFFQGSQAANVTRDLDDAGSNKRQQQRMMHSLVNEEDDDDDNENDFEKEIKSDGGTYNFPWSYNAHTGFGTAAYSVVNKKAELKIISVRTGGGENINADDKMKQQLLLQAKKFISEA